MIQEGPGEGTAERHANGFANGREATAERHAKAVQKHVQELEAATELGMYFAGDMFRMQGVVLATFCVIGGCFSLILNP